MVSERYHRESKGFESASGAPALMIFNESRASAWRIGGPARLACRRSMSDPSTALRPVSHASKSPRHRHLRSMTRSRLESRYPYTNKEIMVDQRALPVYPTRSNNRDQGDVMRPRGEAARSR